jgi:3-oxoacyl-[acyl-carrier-protein] synthase-3
MKYGCCIESLGVYNPKQILSTQELEDSLKLSRPLKLELLTGISERRECDSEEDSLVLAEEAALDCFRFSKYRFQDVEMLIYCGITRYVGGLKHLYEPALSILLKEKLGCEGAICFDITNACAGMLTAVHVASDFIERGVVENCLVVSGEYITSLAHNAIEHIHHSDSPQIASLTLGDAGGAVLLSRCLPEEGIRSSKFVTLADYSELCVAYLSPTQPGGIMETQMKEIHQASIRFAPELVEEVLAEAGMSLDQIDFLIPHQTSKLAIRDGKDYFTRYFGKMASHVVVNLPKLGNTASTSHALTLYQLLRDGRVKRGDRIMFLSFASGLVIGAMIFVVHELADRYGSHH